MTQENAFSPFQPSLEGSSLGALADHVYKIFFFVLGLPRKVKSFPKLLLLLELGAALPWDPKEIFPEVSRNVSGASNPNPKKKEVVIRIPSKLN